MAVKLHPDLELLATRTAKPLEIERVPTLALVPKAEDKANTPHLFRIGIPDAAGVIVGYFTYLATSARASPSCGTYVPVQGNWTLP